MEILKTRANKPPRILIHADHGLGKSSLAAAAPNPVFIQTENGLENIDANAFPLCRSVTDIKTQLDQVYSEEHDFKTLVIDSLDWTEALVFQHICAEGGKDSISDFGYGTGYTNALELFGKIVTALNRIREERNMIIILTAHSQIKTYQNPLGADYDRHQIKLREKNAELFLEWCDLVSFLHFQTYTKAVSSGFTEDKHKGVGGTERVLSCTPSAAYVSKNRYNITEDISLPDPQTGWNNLITAIKGD